MTCARRFSPFSHPRREPPCPIPEARQSSLLPGPRGPAPVARLSRHHQRKDRASREGAHIRNPCIPPDASLLRRALHGRSRRQHGSKGRRRPQKARALAARLPHLARGTRPPRAGCPFRRSAQDGGLRFPSSSSPQTAACRPRSSGAGRRCGMGGRQDRGTSSILTARPGSPGHRGRAGATASARPCRRCSLGRTASGRGS